MQQGGVKWRGHPPQAAARRFIRAIGRLSALRDICCEDVSDGPSVTGKTQRASVRWKQKQLCLHSAPEEQLVNETSRAVRDSDDPRGGRTHACAHRQRRTPLTRVHVRVHASCFFLCQVRQGRMTISPTVALCLVTGTDSRNAGWMDRSVSVLDNNNSKSSLKQHLLKCLDMYLPASFITWQQLNSNSLFKQTTMHLTCWINLPRD